MKRHIRISLSSLPFFLSLGFRCLTLYEHQERFQDPSRLPPHTAEQPETEPPIPLPTIPNPRTPSTSSGPRHPSPLNSRPLSFTASTTSSAVPSCFATAASSTTTSAPQEEAYWMYLGLDEPRGLPPNRTHRDGGEYAWLRENVRRYQNPNAEGENGFNALGLGTGVRVLNEYSRHRECVMRYINPNADGRFEERESTVANRFEERESKKANGFEDGALQGAFLRCSKPINESLAERMRYLEDRRNGPLRHIVCGRTSKVFADVYDLIMHAYTSEIPKLRTDHLGLHKALCVLMRWNYAKAPEASKAYQSVSAEAATNREDLIIWPPTVVIHDTNTGRGKDGRMDGMSDKEVDKKLKGPHGWYE